MFVEITILVWILTLLWFYNRKPSNYPPGPWGFPLIGWPPRSPEDFNKQILKWKEKKQDIIGWRIGTRFIVILLDYDLYSEVLQHPNMNIRPDLRTIVFLKGENGLSLSKGDHWKQNRRLTLRHFREFGMGKDKLLLDAQYEADELINTLKKEVGKPTFISASLQTTLLNTVWQMVGNVRYENNDENLKKYNQLTSEWHSYGFQMMIMDLFSWMNHILPNFLLNILFKNHVQKGLADEMKSFLKNHIQNHEKNLNEANIRDYIDRYLLEMEKQKEDPNSTMSVEDLVFCLSDLFEGSTLTTYATIEAALFYLMKFSNIQEKLQREIDKVLPNGAQFLMKDRVSLPYTEAFINEVLRHSSVVGVNPRAASEDTKIGSYIIPKDAWIFGHQFVIHYDPKYWDAPSEFSPERFLDSNGKFVTPANGFVPFGTGRRSCPGEGIARMQLFVFITKLIQNFHFELPHGEENTLEVSPHPIFRPLKCSPKILLKARKIH